MSGALWPFHLAWLPVIPETPGDFSTQLNCAFVLSLYLINLSYQISTALLSPYPRIFQTHIKDTEGKSATGIKVFPALSINNVYREATH